MNFYVATRLENAAAARALADELKRRGHRQTYDWTAHGSVRGDARRLVEVAVAEVAGVARADLFVALLPGGRGTHVELGLALSAAARERHVVLVGDAGGVGEGTCAFYHHPRVVVVPTAEAALRHVDALAAAEATADLRELMGAR